MIKTESGTLLPATYNSGKYRQWKAKSRHVGPDVKEGKGERNVSQDCGYADDRYEASSQTLGIMDCCRRRWCTSEGLSSKRCASLFDVVQVQC